MAWPLPCDARVERLRATRPSELWARSPETFLSTHKSEIMRTLLCILPLLAGGIAAQTQVVRGDVDGVQGTNRFQLDCTQIPLVSNSVNLQALHDASRQQDIEYEMQVVNVGTLDNPVLDVRSAVVIAETLDMGNLRFGRSENWRLFGAAGSAFGIFVTERANTSYIPFPGLGAWVVGPTAVLFRSGVMPSGVFQFSFTMPTLPNLVGVEFTSQAVLVTGQNLTITHAACKEVRDD
jgi:hypothetical protein